MCIKPSRRQVMKRLFMILILCVPMIFAETIEREFTVDQNPQISVKNVAGNITLVPGDDNVIRVTAKRTEEDIEVFFEQVGNQVEVYVKHPKRDRSERKSWFDHRNDEVVFTIEFPRQGTVYLKSVSGDIDVSGTDGELTLKSVSGDLEIKNVISTDLSATSVSGDVRMKNLDMSDGDALLKSVSGDIVLVHSPDSSFLLKASSVSGDMENNGSNDFKIKKHKYSSSQSMKGDFNGGNGRACFTYG